MLCQAISCIINGILTNSVADPGRYSTDPDLDPAVIKKRIRILLTSVSDPDPGILTGWDPDPV